MADGGTFKFHLRRGRRCFFSLCCPPVIIKRRCLFIPKDNRHILFSVQTLTIHLWLRVTMALLHFCWRTSSGEEFSSSAAGFSPSLLQPPLRFGFLNFPRTRRPEAVGSVQPAASSPLLSESFLKRQIFLLTLFFFFGFRSTAAETLLAGLQSSGGGGR